MICNYVVTDFVMITVLTNVDEDEDEMVKRGTVYGMNDALIYANISNRNTRSQG